MTEEKQNMALWLVIMELLIANMQTFCQIYWFIIQQALPMAHLEPYLQKWLYYTFTVLVFHSHFF